jgi:hypothetical protein
MRPAESRGDQGKIGMLWKGQEFPGDGTGP